MGSKSLTIAMYFISSLACLPSLLQSQQPYEGLATSNCENQHNSTTLLGYFCNGHSKSCQAYLTFHSQPPYQSVSAISALLNSDPSQISQLNSVSVDSAFVTDTKVIVPVTCSCAGAYYQANSSYAIQKLDTDFTIANNTFQGLSSCQALQQQNKKNSSSGYLIASMDITIPLRCACPTTSQRRNGVKYLLSYLVDSNDTVFAIGQQFGVNYTSILEANGLSQTVANIYPFTTLLIPLSVQPNSSQVAKPPPPPQSTPPSSAPPAGKKSNHTPVYVGIGVAVPLCLIILASIVFCIHHKARNKKTASKITLVDDSKISGKPTGKSSSETFTDFGLSGSFLSTISDIGQSLKVYKFEELQLATDNFSHKCRIEGSVYQGLFNGDFAAVKMMNRDVSKELEILKKINHFNLIRLSGLSFCHGHWYLVYEYAQNGPLSNWIFDQSRTMVLSWMRRIQIALDVANGLNYLHSYTEPPYVHKDVKSSNILLDGKFRAKIANFGLARPAEGKEGEFHLTRHIVGTKGYMAPEYLEHGLISPKLDVYSFGVVMLELITGRDALSLQRGEDGFSVKDFITALSQEEQDDKETREKLRSFIDPLMEGDYPFDSAFFMARLIDRCLRKDAASRLNMGEIVQSLSKLFASSLSTASSNSVSVSQGLSS